MGGLFREIRSVSNYIQLETLPRSYKTMQFSGINCLHPATPLIDRNQFKNFIQ